MRRTILYISLALLTFSIGFLTQGVPNDLPFALPLALAALVLIRALVGSRLTPHRLKVTALTLLIWTPFAAATLYAFLPTPMYCEVDLPREEQVQSGEVFTAPPVAYRFVSRSRVMTVGRGCVDMQIYESGDGVKVYTSTQEYESRATAREAFRQAVRDDLKFTERATLFDGPGWQSGERVVATHFVNGEPFSFIYRVEGNRLSYFGSPSLSHLLEFESNYGFILNSDF